MDIETSLIFDIWYLIFDIWYLFTIDLKQFKLLKACGRPEEDKGSEQLTEMDSQTQLDRATHFAAWYSMVLYGVV